MQVRSRKRRRQGDLLRKGRVCWGPHRSGHSRFTWHLSHVLAGLTPALLGGGVAWGVYFFAYNRAKQRYQRWRGAGERLPPALHLASAAEAGALVRKTVGVAPVG